MSDITSIKELREMLEEIRKSKNDIDIEAAKINKLIDIKTAQIDKLNADIDSKTAELDRLEDESKKEPSLAQYWCNIAMDIYDIIKSSEKRLESAKCDKGVIEEE